MQFIIKNQTANPLTYLSGVVTVAANGNTSVPREYNTLLLNDASFLNDAQSSVFLLNNGFSDLSSPSILILAQVFSQFALSPLATLPLYYSEYVDIRQTATTAAGATVWAITNPVSALQNVVIERIKLNMSFDAGTPALGSSLPRYKIMRFSGATPSGGTQLTPIKASSLAPASLVDVRFLDTGLTTTGITFETGFGIISCPAVQGSIGEYIREGIYIKCAPGEGIAIQISDINAVVGQALSGEISWSLR